MKAKQVKETLGITQNTINSYIKKGLIRYHKVNDYHYIYNDDDVYKLAGQKNKKKNERINVIYSRVSLNKQKIDLIEQENRLYNFAINNGYIIDKKFKDIKSGISFDRKEFNILYDMVIKNNVNFVIIENKDRLARFGFEMIEKIFNSFGTKIIVASNAENKTYEQELTEDLVSIIHHFSMKSYSNRIKLNKLKKQLELDN